MEYDGHVEVGGPWQTLRTTAFTISKLAVGSLDNNVYLLRDNASGQQLLIDAANEPDRIAEMCTGKLEYVVTTHCHADHTQALATIARVAQARTICAEPEAERLPIAPDFALSDDAEFFLGETRCEFRTLVGHRRWGSEHVCTSLALTVVPPEGSDIAPHVFTGDALFPGGVGNTCDDQQAQRHLLTDVTTKLFDRLPDSTRVHPGHGADTTLGVERTSLPDWLRTAGLSQLA